MQLHFCHCDIFHIQYRFRTALTYNLNGVLVKMFLMRGFGNEHSTHVYKSTLCFLQIISWQIISSQCNNFRHNCHVINCGMYQFLIDREVINQL